MTITHESYECLLLFTKKPELHDGMGEAIFHGSNDFTEMVGINHEHRLDMIIIGFHRTQT